jgi:hypothetical protein
MSNYRGTIKHAVHVSCRSQIHTSRVDSGRRWRESDGWADISLVFREMWDAKNLDLKCSLGMERLKLAQRYPTSREKRARCGGP